MSILLVIVTLSLVAASVRSAVILDDLDCKIPTCRDFHEGLHHYPKYELYEEVCYDTVYDFQQISQKHGECIHKKTGEYEEPCVNAVANVIQRCIDRLVDVPKKQARLYCGHALMKHCASYVGLEGIPLKQPE